jgi:GT2 family glycosyltransferase
MSNVEISVIILAHGEEPYLSECVRAVVETTAPAVTERTVEVLIIDNGAADAVSALAVDARVRVHRSEFNLGFTGGCNLGAGLARGRNLVFLNSDAVVTAGAVCCLVDTLSDPSIGLATGDVRLAAEPDTMNSAGNPVHYLGVVWAGAFGEPAREHATPVDVASASGAFFAVRREVWNALDGFPAEYFAYHEDTELSLRAWSRGWRVTFVPGATVHHHYEFSRNPRKQYLLERNRWLTVLTVYPRPVLLVVLPMMVAFDLALALLALRQGWLWAKLASWLWLARHGGPICRRRRAVQAVSQDSAVGFAARLSSRIEPAMLGPLPGLEALNWVLESYWTVAKAFLGRMSASRGLTG